MSEQMISIAQQYSDTPAGRNIGDGPFTGERFRVEFLVPALRENQTVTVDLNGVLGFGSSFLEEAFGGLVRAGFTAKELKSKLKIISPIKIYIDRIWKYIENADAHKVD